MKSLHTPSNQESTLSLKEAITRLNLDDTYYLFFTMADIVKYLSDHEAMYNDREGQGCIQGAIYVENLVKQELIQRIECGMSNERMEGFEKKAG